MPSGVTRLPLSDLNPYLTCVICSGYLIDAVTIVECLHSFCRACLLQYLESSATCPICDVQVNKGQLHKCIRSDQTLQDLVYKLVPGLYKSELRRRKDFYVDYFKKLADNPTNSKALSSRSKVQIFDKHLIELSALIYTPDELISLSLEHSSALKSSPDDRDCKEEKKLRKKDAPTDKEARDEDQTTPDEAADKSTTARDAANAPSKRKGRPRKKKAQITELKDLPFRRRFFRCPAAVTIGHLKKLLYYKLELSESCHVEILHSDECLDNAYTLMDVAYIYTWRRKAPMQLYFNIFKIEEAEDESDAESSFAMPLLEAEVGQTEQRELHTDSKAAVA